MAGSLRNKVLKEILIEDRVRYSRMARAKAERRESGGPVGSEEKRERVRMYEYKSKQTYVVQHDVKYQLSRVHKYP